MSLRRSEIAGAQSRRSRSTLYVRACARARARVPEPQQELVPASKWRRMNSTLRRTGPSCSLGWTDASKKKTPVVVCVSSRMSESSAADVPSSTSTRSERPRCHMYVTCLWCARVCVCARVREACARVRRVCARVRGACVHHLGLEAGLQHTPQALC